MKVMKPGGRVRGRRVFLKESTKEIRQGRQVIKSCLVLKDRKEGIQAPHERQDSWRGLFTSPQFTVWALSILKALEPAGHLWPAAYLS